MPGTSLELVDGKSTDSALESLSYKPLVAKQSPITRVGFCACVFKWGKKWLAIGCGWWCIVGLWFGLRFLQHVTQLSWQDWLLGCCQGTTSCGYAGPLHSCNHVLATWGKFKLRNHTSNSMNLTPKTISKLHFTPVTVTHWAHGEKLMTRPQ